MSRFTSALRLCLILFCLATVACAQDSLPSWNDGPARQALIQFVKTTTDSSSPDFVAPEERIATFDQDGTLWVEQPAYAQMMFALDRLGKLATSHPEWKTAQPFASVLAGDEAAIAKFTMKDWAAIVMATHAGVAVGDFRTAVNDWLATATDKRWNRPYTDLVYQPMLEAMRYLRANGYRTYIVTGGGQEFVRTFAERVYGVPPEMVIGSALGLQYTYDAAGNAIIMKEPKLLLNDDKSGKPQDIYLFTGRHPRAAFGNSNGDREMLEYAQASGKASLMMLVLHDDADREYAYGPANGLPDSKIGTFSKELHDEATQKGWIVVSMKKDWKNVFAFSK